MDTSDSRPQTEEVLHARRLLVRFAEHDGQPDYLTSLRAKLADATLHDIYPPFPPLDDVHDLPHPRLGEVQHALAAAARSCGSVEVASIIATAAAELNGDGML